MCLEIRESGWEASRSRAVSPWSASRRRLSESRLEAARPLRSPTVDTEAGVDMAAAGRGDLILGVTGEEGERKPRVTATGEGEGDALLPDGDEVSETESGLDFALGLALALGLGLEAAFLIAKKNGGRRLLCLLEILNFEPRSRRLW